jgi:hypothetical protein
MKKIMTGVMLTMALLASVDMYAQGPPGPKLRRPGPGGALQPVTAFQGTVTRLSANDDDIYDGFYLRTAQDSMLVKFPAHLGAQITSLTKTGSTVTVNGTLEYPPFGGKEVRMVSLAIKGQTIYDTPPAAPVTPPADNPAHSAGYRQSTD